MGLLAQTAPRAPAGPDLAPLVRRFVQGGLWTPLDSTALLFGVFLLSFVMFAVVVGVAQRNWPSWLRGIVDVRRNLELVASGLEILRRNKRPLWIVLIAAVASWSGWLLGVWRDESQRTEIESMLAVRENSVLDFAASHSFTTALGPLLDLTGLGDLLPLVLGACFLLFLKTVDVTRDLRVQAGGHEAFALKRRLGTAWVGMVILLVYRVIVFAVAPRDAPIGGCMMVDAVIVPVILLATDGLLLSWVLTEFGRGLRGHLEWESDDTVEFIRSVPAAACICFLMNPGRYVVLAAAMLEAQWNQASPWPASRWGPILTAAGVGQALGVVWFVLPCVLIASRRGGLVARFAAFGRLLRQAGGQVIGLTGLAMLFSFLVTLPVHWMFGSMQPETWSLFGAAAYRHYATLVVGLVALAGGAQLAAQELGVTDEPLPEPVLLAPANDAMTTIPPALPVGFELPIAPTNAAT